MPETKELTFGQKAVGITFNPGGNPEVDEVKQKYAELIDLLHLYKEGYVSLGTSPEKVRMLSIAITEAQTSQMWSIKSLTWQY